MESLSREVCDAIRFEVEVVHFKRCAHQQEFAITPFGGEFIQGDSAVIPDAFSNGRFAGCPFAIIEVRHEPIFHTGREGDIAETPGGVFFHLVLILGGIDRSETPGPVLWQWLANGLPVILPFPILVERAICFECVRGADDVIILALFGFCGFDVFIPEGSGCHRKHIALELGHVSRCGHGIAEM